MTELPANEGVSPGKDLAGGSPGVLDPGPPEVLPPTPSDDVVPTKRRRKRGGSNIAVINQRAKLRSMETSLQLKELICEHGYSVSKACRELGITRRHGGKLWAVWVDRVRRFKEGTLEEVKKGEMEVRAYCEHNTQRLIERCLNLVEDNPAYAAGALRGMELLCKLRGVKLDEIGTDAGNKAAADAQATLEAARSRAGEALGLAVDLGAIEQAEKEVERSGVMRILDSHLVGLGAGESPAMRDANNPLKDAEE